MLFAYLCDQKQLSSAIFRVHMSNISLRDMSNSISKICKNLCSRRQNCEYKLISYVHYNKTIDSVDLKMLLWSDIYLGIINQFLFCKYHINSWKNENPKIMLFYDKMRKKFYQIQIRRIQHPLPPHGPTNVISILKCYLTLFRAG